MKDIFANRAYTKWIGFAIVFILFVSTIWISNKFVNQIMEEEKFKMELYADAWEVSNSEELNSTTQDFLLKFFTNNKNIPVALLDENYEVLYTNNIDENITEDPIVLDKYVKELIENHTPIVINLPDGKNYIYYQNSELVTQLRYYPILLVLSFVAFVMFTLWYYRTLKNTEQSFLWAGMAKETAHQIGTPLSSLMGWVELLKMEDIDQTPVIEIEKDVNRLSQITERFSKIGSAPELTVMNIVELTRNTTDYLRSRISKKIEVKFSSEKEEIRVKVNATLYSWVIENLTKNAADAMQNSGVLGIYIETNSDKVEITVHDTGPGIPLKFQKRVFEPGFSTKKRGWGLGLSLAKRIIEDYHKGQIFVAKSDRSFGTEIKIILNMT